MDYKKFEKLDVGDEPLNTMQDHSYYNPLNIDERLNRYKTPLSKTTLMLTEQDIKQLIRDVLAEVKPKKGITISTEDGKFESMVSLDHITAKIKELGL